MPRDLFGRSTHANCFGTLSDKQVKKTNRKLWEKIDWQRFSYTNTFNCRNYNTTGSNFSCFLSFVQTPPTYNNYLNDYVDNFFESHFDDK